MGWETSKFQRQLFSLIIISSITNQVLAFDLQSSIQNHKNQFEKVALDLWDLAEMGYQETESVNILSSELKKEGFTITKGVAGIPTAFIAEYSNGGPVIGILGEYDALPGLAQSKSPFKEVIDNTTGAGQACGHHLFGAASAWAAVTIKEWLVKNNIKGTIRFYGTPAEEGGSGKVYLVRAGLFDDVDAVLHWHPDDNNAANSSTNNSNKSAKFTFKGIAAHAAGSPDEGRSALDGVESMNMMVNMMREHIPQSSRIHYVITKGGLAPNVVPDLAQVYYYVRHPEMKRVEELFNRVATIAEAAAMGTETSMTYEVMHGNYSLLPNEILQKLVHQKLSELGGIKYSKKEEEYAKELYKSFINPDRDIGSQENVRPYKKSHSYGSTDVGDVSWNVPTAGMRIASWVPGTPAHSWQAVSSGGTSIGLKGAELAAKTLSATIIELFENPQLIKEANDELNARVGEDFVYKALLGDRQPPLNYRN